MAQRYVFLWRLCARGFGEAGAGFGAALKIENYEGMFLVLGELYLQDAMLELTLSLTDLKVYPNPATDYVTFEYKLPEYVEQATLVITSITGKVVYEFDLKDIAGQILWDTRTIENGIYFYALKRGDKTLTSGKVSIMK